MGVSTNAVLFYGILLQEDDFEDGYPWDADDDCDTDDYIAHRLGSLVDPTDWSRANQAEVDAYFAAKNAILATTPVRIGIHCSYDYPMYYIYIEESETTAYRGFPESISALTVDPAWDP